MVFQGNKRIISDTFATVRCPYDLNQTLYRSLDEGVKDGVYGKLIFLAVDCVISVGVGYQTVMATPLQRTSRIERCGSISMVSSQTFL